MIRHTTLLFVLLACALSLALFSVKYQVQDLEEELVGLERSIVSERQAIHVLKAEWSHLNDPSRLGALAREYLGMKPVAPNRVATFETISNDIASEENANSAVTTSLADRKESQ